MNIQKKFTAAFTLALLSSAPLYAAEAPMAEQSRVEMVSGGIGDSGLDDITAVQNSYNLKLIFAEDNGAYLADIGVLIRDQKGNTVVNTTSGGPILLINLRPGTYLVSSTIAGETKTQRVTVRGSGLSTHYVHLHSTES